MKKQPKTKSDINIVGILQLFAIASVLFMAYIVIMGVDDIIAKAMTIPALIWVTIILVTKFAK